jgi:hypothetical protein
MWTETKTPIVIYATDTAMETEALPLSRALQTFVKFENKAFQKELAQEEADAQRSQQQQEQQQGESSVPANIPEPTAMELTAMVSAVSPSKRKYRDGSPDSMATNRASLGGSDTNSRAGDFDPFGDGDGDGLATELSQFPTPPGMSEDPVQFPATPSKYALALGAVEGSSRGRGENDYENQYPEEGNRFADQQPSPPKAKAPEMAERAGGSPFLTRGSVGSSGDGSPQKSVMDVDMSLPAEHEP